jgi:hypothetical protein
MLLLLLSSLLWLCYPLLGLDHFFSFLILYTVGRTALTGNQPIERTLSTHKTTQTLNKHTDIHASDGIQTYAPIVWAGKDSSCLRLCSHCYWHCVHTVNHKSCLALYSYINSAAIIHYVRYIGEWMYRSMFLDLSTSWRRVVSFSPRPLYWIESIYTHWKGGCGAV